MERLVLDRFASPWLKNQHLARYRWAAGMAEGRRVLDLACGSGYGSRLLRAGGARSVVSADVSEEAFRDAARQDEGGTTPLRGALADAAALPFRDRSFDLYVSFETIEHVAADADVVREARRVLASGGVFLCSTPEREVISPGRTLDDPPDNPYHEREYALGEFEALLRPAFPAIEWFGQTRCSRSWKRLLAGLGRRSPFLARKAHQLRNLAHLPVEGQRRHAPYRLRGAPGWPEVLIACCRVGGPAEDSETAPG